MSDQPQPQSGENNSLRATVRTNPHVKRIAKGRWSFLLLVVFPIALVVLYFGIFATSQYVCESTLSIQSPGESVSLGDTLAGLVGGASAGNKDLFVLNEFIHSPAMALQLDEQHALKTHFSQNTIDPISRLSKRASQEEFLDYYNGKVKTRLHNESGLVYLKVYTYEPAYCTEVSKSILEKAETFVNAMSEKIQQDFLRFSSGQLASAEQDLKDARDRMLEYQKAHNMLDPEQSAGNALSIIGTLEQQMALLEVEIAEKSRILNPESPALQGLKSRRSALSHQIEQERNRLTEEQSKGTTASALADYQEILMLLEFSKKRYEMALQLWETAQPEALRKSRYVLPVSEPMPPEEARGLNRIKEIAGWALGILLVYLCGALLFFSVRDHIES